ncbi:non-ribosomal peptide synthetase [Actinacidiphila acididurans]|uniref:non-ribosomal peptide synthetase n=1 Tax=Actinacidiphila acididurans TaxID=2784346 RepID=UPI001F3C9944|nr:non-ribosomal peptide synthetase [Actinacidiphila acididurans]
MTTGQVSVLDGIERAVRDFPEHAALRTDRSISYREFGELVDAFAGRLSARTAPGEFIGIRAERGAAAIVAMVGALRARRPFVFIDGRDSTSSNSDKVRLLGVRLLAGSSAGAPAPDLAEVPAQWRPSDAAASPLATSPGPAALPAFADGELAYAIQTSGSTGRPKCVLVRTAPLAAVIRDHVERLDVGPGCVTLQFARLTFDGCVTEILWTLTVGACLVVVEEAHLAPGAVLRDTLERFGITHLKTTPFALTTTEPDGLRLRHVVNGGGACRPAVVHKWSAVADFHNAYGLTETTVCNLLTEPLDPADCRESVPLGDVVGDCDYWIRDVDAPAPDTPAAGPVPRGELVVTGASVAAGYLTEHGVRPFARPGAPDAYRTGDVVELRDGRLYFVERLDRQVKVRGYRLDPGEIENAVCRLASVRDAVVVAEAHDGAGGADPSTADALVCYYQGDADARALRRHLGALLDPYKIPSVFTRIDAFPYTPNGKVDRDALRARRHEAAGDDGTPASPGDQVLHVVRTLTGTGDIGLDDNFFEVGGDSASAIVLVTRMRELGWADAGVRDVLRAENLRVLADHLAERSV